MASLRGWTWWCAEHLEGNFMWRGKPGTWMSARAAPAGRDASCAIRKFVPQRFARHPSETRTPVAICVQVIKKGKGGVPFRKTTRLNSFRKGHVKQVRVV